jgi:uncharacterized membrane protein YbhN (UPF0104 family)
LRFSLLPVIAIRLGVGVGLPSLLLFQLMAFYGLAYTPVPGGGGAVEAGFFAFFSGLMPKDELGLLLVVWRSFAYYAYLVGGGVATLISSWLEGRRPPTPREAALGASPKEITVRTWPEGKSGACSGAGG